MTKEEDEGDQGGQGYGIGDYGVGNFTWSFGEPIWRSVVGELADCHLSRNAAERAPGDGDRKGDLNGGRQVKIPGV